jgi:hypothetical protein
MASSIAPRFQRDRSWCDPEHTGTSSSTSATSRCPSPRSGPRACRAGWCHAWLGACEGSRRSTRSSRRGGRVSDPQAAVQVPVDVRPDFARAFVDGRFYEGLDHAVVLRRVRCPLLVLHADRHRYPRYGLVGTMDDADAARIQELVPHSQHRKIPANHVIHKSTQFIEAIEEFAVSVENARPRTTRPPFLTSNDSRRNLTPRARQYRRAGHCLQPQVPPPAREVRSSASGSIRLGLVASSDCCRRRDRHWAVRRALRSGVLCAARVIDVNSHAVSARIDSGIRESASASDSRS